MNDTNTASRTVRIGGYTVESKEGFTLTIRCMEITTPDGFDLSDGLYTDLITVIPIRIPPPDDLPDVEHKRRVRSKHN